MVRINKAIPLVVFTTALMSTPVTGAQVVLDRIIAVVDEDVITQSELNIRVKSIKAQVISSGQQMPPDDILNKQIVERLIIENLQLQMANRAGVRISDEELNEAMLAIAQQNNMNLAEFSVAIQQDGITYADMRDQVRREITISRVQQGVMRNRIRITEQEIKNFLSSEVGQIVTADEFRIAHILLPFPDTPNSDQILKVKKDSEAIISQVQQGANFQSLAIEKSAGQNALSGGDLGWRKAGELPTMFSDIAPEMESGDIRGPIKSGSGYHIIMLLEKRGAKAEGNVDQSEVRHVLIKPSEIRTDEEAMELAESLREEIIGGRSFEEIAKLHSDDPGSALDGGNLGWNREGTFVPEFERQVEVSVLNEISPVFRTVHGYHFLEITGSRVEDFSDMFRMGQAERYLRNQKMDEEVQTWIMEIREDAFVEIRI
jgi:peptidyl-prolyl cis-trans isomerase SurA